MQVSTCTHTISLMTQNSSNTSRFLENQVVLDGIRANVNILRERIAKTYNTAAQMHFKRVKRCPCHTNRDYGPGTCCECKYEKISTDQLLQWADQYTAPMREEMNSLIAEHDRIATEMNEIYEAAEQLTAIKTDTKMFDQEIDLVNLVPQSGTLTGNHEQDQDACMVDALVDVFEEEAESGHVPSNWDDAFDEATIAIVPPDADDDFVNAVQRMDCTQQNPITFYESIGGVYQDHTIAYYWDELLTIEPHTCLREYIDAMELTYPHLKEDMMGWILHWTSHPVVARPWDTTMCVTELIEKARTYFVNNTANHITARLRMGYDDRRLQPQAGLMDSAKHVAISMAKTYFPQAMSLAPKTDADMEAIVDLMENLLLFYEDVNKCTTSLQCQISVYRFLKMQFHISIAKSCYVWMGQFVEGYTQTMEEIRRERTNAENVEPQSGFGDFMDAYKTVTRSSVFEKLSKLSMLIASLTVCLATGTNLTMSMFYDISKKVYSGLQATDMIGQILEAIQAIYHKCIPVLMGKASLSSIWVGLGDGKQLDADIVDFMTAGTRYVDGTSNDNDVQPQFLLVNAEAIQTKLREMMERTKDAVSRSHLKRTILQVETVRQGVCNRYNNAGMRAAPYCLSFNGLSGCGKTCCILEVSAAIQIALGIPAGPQHVFRIDEGDEYQSGLNSQHNVYVIDDFGNTKPDHYKVVPTDIIIQLVNNCPKFAVMADLAAKGAVPMKPKLVCITTNIKEMHAKTFSISADSILRRPNRHITMRVRPQFADSSGKLRVDVDPQAHAMDVWEFDVETWMPLEPNNIKGFVYSRDDMGPMRSIPFARLLRFLVKDSLVHHTRQDRYLEHANSAHLALRCKCGVPMAYCDGCEFNVIIPQAGWLDSKCATINRVLGVRDVYYHPYGKDLIGQVIKPWVYTLLAVTIVCLTQMKHTKAIVGAWLLAILVFALISVYRVCTYNISMEVGTVVQDCMGRLRDTMLGNKAKIAAILVSVAGLYMLKSRNKVEPQGSTPSRPRVNIELTNVPDNWRRQELAPVIKNTDEITTTGRQLAEVLMSKICLVSVFTDTTHKYASAIPVCTNFWIVPHHLIESDYVFVRVQHSGTDVINYAHTAIREGSYRRIGDTDFALLYMPGKGDQRDIIKFFPSVNIANPAMTYRQRPSRLVLLEPHHKVCPESGKNILVPERSVHCIQATSSMVAPANIAPYWGGNYESPVPTFTGMCGAALIAEGNGPYILGLHAAGVSGKKTASYCAITREDIQECINVMTAPDTPMMQGSEEGPMYIDSESMPFKHEVPGTTHLSFMESAEVDIVGCHAGRKRRYTTMVRETEYSNAVKDKFGVECKHGAPALINHWYPARLWLESCANSKPVNTRLLDFAYKNYRMRVLKHLAAHPDDLADICVLEDIVNTSGLDGVKGLYKPNYKASAGIPYGVPKEKFVQQSKDFFDGISVPYELTDEMKKDVEFLENIYKSGKRGYAPHRANRKDEAIKIGKAKVRIFSGTSMPYLFLMRKYFLTISVYMQRYPEVFESAVGVNPYSGEWTRLYKYISSFGVDRIIAGDYEKYDQFVHSSLTYAAFKILIEIAKIAGFDEEDLMVMRGLATDTCNPLYELDGLWLKIGGSSPSGHGLTVVINGIVNSFYARIAFYMVAISLNKPCFDFNKYVAFMSYGDDNVMSVSEEASFFTHCSYQEALKSFGLNYTMANKTAESVPYIHMREATFLKRSWVYSEKFGRYLAPLEEDSIFKMLHTYTLSKAVPKEQQLADILRSANQEFFMHGEEKFTSARDKLEQIASEFELKHYLPNNTLPDLLQMEEWYGDM